MKLLSIDIGTKNIKMCEGEYTKGTVKITKCDCSPYEDKIVDNSGVKDSDALGVKLSAMFNNNSFSVRRAVVTVNTSNVLVREFELPYSKNKKQFSAMVTNEMITTYAAEENDTVEYRILSVSGEKNEAKAIVRAMAIKKEISDGYYNAVMAAKLHPDIMFTHINALEHLLTINNNRFNGEDLTGKSVMLVDFGHSGIMAYLFSDSTVYTSRFIPVGLSDLAAELESQMLITGEQALTDISSYITLDGEPESGDRIATETKNFFVQCTNELQKVIMYIIGKMPQAKLSRVFITGGGARIQGIENYFTSALGAPCSQLKDISGVSLPAGFDISDFLNASGAVITM